MDTDNKKLILLIEDETAVADIYIQMLQDAGYKVMFVDNGTLGMKAVREQAWDLLILDIMLPGKDGMKILEDISRHPQLKKGPIVVVSNLNNEITIKDAFKFGVSSYIIKSEINPDTLVSEITTAFSK